MGEAGGVNLYNFVFNNTNDCIDPLGDVVVLVHGVNTDAAWFSTAEKGLKAYWNSTGQNIQEIIPFKWGDTSTSFGLSRKQGGQPNYATDSVAGMRDSNRKYMMVSVDRLKRILNLLNSIKEKEKSCEPISIIAHSQGTIISLAALQGGSKVDTFIMMGSPLDVLPFNSETNDLLKALAQIRGKTYNYWSPNDEWAWFKGGIGAKGNEIAKIQELGWITNRKFAPDETIGKYKLPHDKPFDEYNHSDYMLSADFFTNIHGPDLAPAPDIIISKNPGINQIKAMGSIW